MNPLEIWNEVRAKPFRPFRIHMSDGSSYPVPHPEFILVTRTRVTISLSPGEDQLPERAVVCDPIHITRIEPLDAEPIRQS
jgi:hypothetical protein